jgi:hypothetical protein
MLARHGFAAGNWALVRTPWTNGSCATRVIVDASIAVVLVGDVAAFQIVNWKV